MDKQAELRQRIKQRISTSKQSTPESVTGIVTVPTSQFFQTVLTALPLITAAIYMMGMARHYGYVNTYGIDISEFPLPADTTLLVGFISLLNFIYPYIMWLLGGFFIIFICLFVLLLLPSFRLKIRQNWQQTWLKHYITKKINILRRSKSTLVVFCLDVLSTLYDKFTIIVIPTLLAVMAALYCIPQGAVQAKKEISQLAEGTLPITTFISSSTWLSDTPHIRIICNTTHCAYRLKDGKTLILRHDQVEQTYHP
ncbi:TPA: hypothetical protein ACSP3M_001771 [Aeromonas veronii]